MSEAEAAQLLWDGEGDQEVGHGEEPSFLFGGPDLLIERSTAGAVSMVAAVVGVVSCFAAFATVESSAEFGSAARKDASHGPVMGSAQVLPVSLSVGRPMLSEQLCKVESHAARTQLLGVGEGIESAAGGLLADLGEMEVAHDLFEGAVSEVGRDLTHGGASFEHVGSEGMAQGIDTLLINSARRGSSTGFILSLAARSRWFEGCEPVKSRP